jgi:hypothetical protein
VSSSRGAELTVRFRNALIVAALFHGSQFREGGKSVILGPDHKTQLGCDMAARNYLATSSGALRLVSSVVGRAGASSLKAPDE